MKIYNEVGLNWGWGWRSYEIEFNNKEERYKGWYRGIIRNVYLRIWFLKTVMVVDKNGFKFKNKDKFNFKVLIGFEIK